MTSCRKSTSARSFSIKITDFAIPSLARDGSNAITQRGIVVPVRWAVEQCPERRAFQLSAGSHWLRLRAAPQFAAQGQEDAALS